MTSEAVRGPGTQPVSWVLVANLVAWWVSSILLSPSKRWISGPCPYGIGGFLTNLIYGPGKCSLWFCWKRPYAFRTFCLRHQPCLRIAMLERHQRDAHREVKKKCPGKLSHQIYSWSDRLIRKMISAISMSAELKAYEDLRMNHVLAGPLEQLDKGSPFWITSFKAPCNKHMEINLL